MCQTIEKFCTEALSKLLQPLWKIVFMRPGYARLPKSTGKLRSISIHRWMDFSCCTSYYYLTHFASTQWCSSIFFFVVNCMKISCMSMCCGCLFCQATKCSLYPRHLEVSTRSKKNKQQGPKRKNTMLVALSLELCRWCRRCRIEFLQPQGAHFQIVGQCCLSDSFHQNESFKWISAKWQATARKSMQQGHKLHG